MWYQRYKMKKVKAGVLLYALLMAAIFSLLLQFYLHRQVAERRILKTSQDRLRAYALVQLALEKRKSDEKAETETPSEETPNETKEPSENSEKD